MTESLYFSLVFLAAVVGLSTAVFALVYRDRAGAKPLAVFAGAASLWAIVEGLSVVQSGEETMALWTAVALSVSVLLPPAWLLFVLEYTGNERWLTPRVFAALLIEPVAFLGLVWTNESHELVWTSYTLVSYGPFDSLALEFGLGFWGHQVYSYLLLTVGAVLLGQLLLRRGRHSQLQGTVLLVAIVVPISANAAYSFGFFPRGLDPTPMAYVFAGIVLTATVLQTELLGVAPATREVGREAVLAELDDAIIILDDDHRIVDINPAAQRLLGTASGGWRGHPLESVNPTLAATLTDEAAQAELQLEREGRVRYYDIRVSDLYRGYGLVSGQVLSLRDVTEQRQREQRLDVLNRLLRHNVRNELNLVRGKVELAQAEIEMEIATAHLQDAINAVDTIVDRTDKLGRFSRMLDADGADRIDIAAEIRAAHQRDRLAPAAGEIIVDLPDRVLVSGGTALVAVFEELLANAIEHNDSEQPRGVLRVNEEKSGESHVVFEVSDNGPGLNEQERNTILAGRETPMQHSSGVGLWLVNWVVERAGGTISVENDEAGCTVSVRLPRATASTA